MASSIIDILKSNYVEGVFHTHVSMIKPRGKYLFSREIFEDFWSIYCNLMCDAKNLGLFGIAEKPQHYYMVVADFDIKIEEKDLDPTLRQKLLKGEGIIDDHVYSEKHIKHVIEIFQATLRLIVENCDDTRLTCCLLEKKMYSVEKNGIKYYKSGFHLAFPYIILSKTDQETHLNPRVVDSLKELGVFEDIGYEDSSKLFDTGISGKPWLLYGSRKEESKPYILTKIYDSEITEMTLEEEFGQYQLLDNRERLIDIAGRVKEYLPRILSIIPYGRSPCELRSNIELVNKDRQILKQKNHRKENLKTTIDENLKISEKLLPMLALFRSEEHDDWLTIGWVLYNIGEGCQEALDQWLDFSSRSVDNFDENECILQWDKMTKKDYTIGTLKFYAKSDNPEMYSQFVKEQGMKYIKASLEGSHHDIAKLLYTEYGTEFVCASVTNKTWYQFIGHRWEEVEEGVFLRDRISSEIVEKYGKLGADYFLKATTNANSENDDGPDEKSYNIRIKQIQKLVIQLKSVPYKQNVMKEAADIFYNKNFKHKLDTNPYLFGFKNGVYDLKLNVFRSGRPEDFISNCAAIDYVNYSPTDKKVLEIYDFLEKIFPNKAIRKYFMDQSSDVFVGGNHQKVVIFWTGEGDNGKSVTQSFFDKMLGTMAIKFSTTLITGKKTQIGAAGPELARAGGGVRWAVLEEPDIDEDINVGMLKSLSGNDSYWARDLFEKGKSTREIQPLFKLVFICLAGNTNISLSNGTSFSLDKMVNNKHKLLSWDSKIGSLIPLKQNAFIDKGVQECLTIKLIDGREITCTYNHKFLTSDNIWIEAKDITSKIKLKAGITNPNCDDVFNEYKGKLKLRKFKFNLENIEDKLLSMSYVRLMGFHNSTIKNKIDTESILIDIGRITDDTPTLTKTGLIPMPYELLDSFNISEFVANNNVPTFLLREYIATVFGCRGEIDENNFISIHEPEDIANILLTRFDIISTVTGSGNRAVLNINNISSIQKFCKNIGSRYCNHKSYTLSIINSYYNSPYDSMTDFTAATNMYEIFDEIKDGEIPCYNIPVIEIIPAGEKHVYDINVDEPYSNFLAEGIVTHNCNGLPAMKYSDKATWNRIRVIPFETTFVKARDECADTYEEQLREKRFPMDPEFTRKIPDLLSAFAWVLLEHRISIQGKERTEPEEVRIATSMYRKQNDIYRQFVEERIVEDQKYIRIDEMYDDFKLWYRGGFPGNTIPVKNDVKDYFSKFWGEPEPGVRWYGYRIRCIDDDVQEGTAIILNDEDLVTYDNAGNIVPPL